MRALFLIFFVSACTSSGPKGDPGPQGPMGLMGLPGAAGSLPDLGVTFDGSAPGALCVPGRAFCLGSNLWSCTLSGYDATGGTDCALQGTASNPSVCSTSNCLPSTGPGNACCRPSKPIAAWTIASPVTRSGSLYFPNANETTFATSSCARGFDVYYRKREPTCSVVGGSLDAIDVSFFVPDITSPGTFTLPTTGLYLETNSNSIGDPALNCFNWTGTVTWDSAPPSWKVTIDATCASPVFALKATLNGEL